jgi:phospholipase/carboxylesterase
MEFSLFHKTVPPRAGLDAASDRKTPLLLLLHGYGANEDDLLSLANYLDPRFLVVSARAPISLGGASYAWFNLGFTPQGIMINPEEIETARQTARRFLGEIVEHYKVDPSSVYLMGFSQGAMMSLACSLTFPGVASGVVALSGRLLPQTVELIGDHELLTGLPIFVGHGVNDPLLPIGHGREIRTKLETLPVDLTYREYEMAHEISIEEVRDVAAWLTARV